MIHRIVLLMVGAILHPYILLFNEILLLYNCIENDKANHVRCQNAHGTGFNVLVAVNMIFIESSKFVNERYVMSCLFFFLSVSNVLSRFTQPVKRKETKK